MPLALGYSLQLVHDLRINAGRQHDAGLGLGTCTLLDGGGYGYGLPDRFGRSRFGRYGRWSHELDYIATNVYVSIINVNIRNFILDLGGYWLYCGWQLRVLRGMATG